MSNGSEPFNLIDKSAGSAVTAMTPGALPDPTGPSPQWQRL
jgi:hypothetical protein